MMDKLKASLSPSRLLTSYRQVPTTQGSYKPLMNDVDTESGSSTPTPEKSETVRTSWNNTKRSRWHDVSKVLNVVFMTIIALLLAAYATKRPADVTAGKQVQAWSPVSDEAYEYEDLDFDNAFAHKTKYRGPPSPELDEAWTKLWFYGGIRVPEDKLPLLNRTADLGNGKTLKPVEDEEGGYHALLEVFHQLHCLNLIRQYTWRDWYFRHPDVVDIPADMRAGDVGARMHVDHCIEALRITLMCHADTTPYLMMLDPTAPQGARADFSPHHKCRNFEKIVDWTEKNQLAKPVMHHGHGS